MKLVITIQLVSSRENGRKSNPQRGSSPHAVAKRTCVRVTERDRSCVDRECRGAIEPRDLYNCGSSPVRTGRTPSLCVETKAMGRSRDTTYATKHRRGLRTTHALKRIVRELREGHAGAPPENKQARQRGGADKVPGRRHRFGGGGERTNRIWRASRRRAEASFAV